ncbi:hypothetical protein KBC04_03410 [Candidatus Babeliales bacterium]|nr:hypothetical protein [Candidatus Babeliales bacterium]MBP9843900.1 hypothetical protein [Candidatus Babeliales bacterium]
MFNSKFMYRLWFLVASLFFLNFCMQAIDDDFDEQLFDDRQPEFVLALPGGGKLDGSTADFFKDDIHEKIKQVRIGEEFQLNAIALLIPFFYVEVIPFITSLATPEFLVPASMIAAECLVKLKEWRALKLEVSPPADLYGLNLEKYPKPLRKVIQESHKKYQTQLSKAQKELRRLEDNYKSIENKLIKKGIALEPIELPARFEIARNAQGQPLRNEKGAYFNLKGEKCEWDAQKKKWKLTTCNGSKIYYNPLVPEVAKSTPSKPLDLQPALDNSKQPVIHQKIEESKVVVSQDLAVPEVVTELQSSVIQPERPMILDHPQQDFIDLEKGCHYPKEELKQPDKIGCGSTTPVKWPTNTGHEPVEIFPEKTTGCGGKVEELDVSLILQNEKYQTTAKEELLPKSGKNPFEPKKHKGKGFLRDKQGGYIDKHNRSWNWDPVKGEWDVVGKKGHKNVNPKGKETHPGTDPSAQSDTSKSKR